MSDKPIRNVLFFLADQHRSDCIGCYGNDVVRTPNIDRLAQRGIRFDRAFTPAAICTPARACIQTGLTQRKHGLIFNWEFQPFRGGELNLDRRTRMFANDLGDAGWQLAHLGKWHIGDANRPADYGYEGPHYPGYGFPDTHAHYRNYLAQLGLGGFNLLKETRSPRGFLRDALQEGPPEASVPGYLAHQTIEMLDRFTTSDRPWFVSCNFWGPHQPFRITNPHYDMYDPADCRAWPNFDAPLDDKPRIMQRQIERFDTASMDEAELRQQIARHYGYVTLIDDQIGRVLDKLEALDQLDETLIIYAADHGSGLGSFRMWDKGFGMYENLWRVPLIFSHPSLKPGSSDAFVNLLDLAPTFAALAGLSPRGELDGLSLLPLLAGEAQRVREPRMVFEHYGHPIPCWQRMVRFENCKYIYNPTDRDEFYDLADDPWEMRNIIDEVPRQRVQPLRDALREHIHATGDPVRGWSSFSLD